MDSSCLSRREKDEAKKRLLKKKEDKMRRWVSVLFAWFIAYGSSGQTPAIIQRQGNGMLTWTNSVTNVQYRIEWASTLEGPWYYSWESLSHIRSGTNYLLTASIPMFYRVVMLPESEHLTISANPTTILSADHQLTVLSVSGGTPPYSWSVSDLALGNVSPSTGYSVIYTRGAQGDNAVVVQDSGGDYALIVIQQP
jgi:hypothetical protein